MTLIVEDGTVVAGAESYATTAAADTRCASLGLTSWAALGTSVKEIALRKATQFMVQVYRSRWSGYRTVAAQLLDWPRYGVVVEEFTVASNIVPAEVVNACIDLAYRVSTDEELLPDLDTGANQIKRDKTGPLETEYFEANVPSEARFVAVDAMLEPFFGKPGTSGSIKLVRA